MKTRLAVCLGILAMSLSVGSAGVPSSRGGEVAEPDRAGELVGTWVRQIRGAEQHAHEGLALDPQGRFGLVNLHSMHGQSWSLDGTTLELQTNTERYPVPERTHLDVVELTAERLVLVGDGYLAGDYTRDDTAAGWVTGTVAYRERMALPPDAILSVRLEDVSRQDVAASSIAFQTVAGEGRQVPIPFHLVYETRLIDERMSYAIRAWISYGDRRQFMNTTSVPVLTRGAGTHVDIMLERVGG